MARQHIFHPEDRARTTIDGQLAEAGWLVQSRELMNRSAGLGVAVCEFATASGPVDYALFVGGTLCGVVEAKPEGTTLSGFSDQASHLTEAIDYGTSDKCATDPVGVPVLRMGNIQD